MSENKADGLNNRSGNMSPPPVCRCCLSEACYKDLSDEYFHSGQREVYADMLLDTFNLTISYQGGSKRLICEDCVLKLRDAAEFKKQVVLAEAAIADRINGQFELQPKPEKADCDEYLGSLDDGDHHHHHGDDDAMLNRNDGTSGWPIGEVINNDGGNIIIKQELEAPEYEKQITNKRRSSRKTTKIGTKEKSRRKKNASEIRSHKKKAPKSNKENSPAPSKSRPKVQAAKVPLTQSQIDTKHNSLQLVLNSNLCIFDSLKTKYRCFYCKLVYLDMAELKKHATMHSNADYVTTCINRLRISCKNVEISDLRCSVCTEIQTDLRDLQTHLIQVHSIDFHGDAHFLVPYKILDGFRCAVCMENFNNFYKLSVHMNTHYTNHVCETCGMSYINRISLRIHIHRMHKEKKCSKCPATFLSSYSRVRHMRKAHDWSETKRYCLLCDKTFRYSYSLIEHKIQEHGAKRQTVNCPQCGKTIMSAASLRVHVRSVHIRERNYPCQYCGTSFFTSCDQRRHERTHQDTRSFSCSYCEGRFKSKDSLRRHLRRQHGHLATANAEQ